MISGSATRSRSRRTFHGTFGKPIGKPFGKPWQTIGKPSENRKTIGKPIGKAFFFFFFGWAFFFRVFTYFFWALGGCSDRRRLLEETVIFGHSTGRSSKGDDFVSSFWVSEV